MQHMCKMERERKRERERDAHLIVRLQDSWSRHLLPDGVEVAVVRGSLPGLGKISSHAVG